jgi:hypothetical protein
MDPAALRGIELRHRPPLFSQCACPPLPARRSFLLARRGEEVPGTGFGANDPAGGARQALTQFLRSRPVHRNRGPACAIQPPSGPARLQSSGDPRGQAHSHYHGGGRRRAVRFHACRLQRYRDPAGCTPSGPCLRGGKAAIECRRRRGAAGSGQDEHQSKEQHHENQTRGNSDGVEPGHTVLTHYGALRRTPRPRDRADAPPRRSAGRSRAAQTASDDGHCRLCHARLRPCAISTPLTGTGLWRAGSLARRNLDRTNSHPQSPCRRRYVPAHRR